MHSTHDGLVLSSRSCSTRDYSYFISMPAPYGKYEALTRQLVPKSTWQVAGSRRRKGREGKRRMFGASGILKCVTSPAQKQRDGELMNRLQIVSVLYVREAEGARARGPSSAAI